MADSVVHVEMKDVLNSVRRLVSEDSPYESPEPAQEEECFVLTPAHRVGNRDPGFRHRANDTETAPQPIEKTEEPEQPAELEQLLTDVSRETAPEESATATEHPEDAPPANFTAAEYQSMAEAWKNELANNAGDDAPAFPTQTKPAASGDITLEDRIAELEEAVMRSHDDWEPDGSEPSRKPEIHRHLYEVVNNTVSDGADNGSAVDGVHEAEIPAASADAERPDTDESEVVTPVFSHVVPDTKSTLVLVEPVADPRNDTQANEPEPEIAQDEPETPVDFPNGGNEIVAEDDVFLDVEALRAMIGDLVREELQGKMGERITHNVRQMVRQEIERALLDHEE